MDKPELKLEQGEYVWKRRGVLQPGPGQGSITLQIETFPQRGRTSRSLSSIENMIERKYYFRIKPGCVLLSLLM